MTIRPFLFPVCVCLAVALLAIASCVDSTAAGDPERGRYLVERVAMCQDCHSPRDDKGQFVPGAWLMGSPLPFQPTVPMPWQGAAPRLAGLPTLSDVQAVHFLTTGELPGGRRPLPPMPEYRFSPADARDVVAWLRSPVAPPAVAH
jgi:mono/diheme cytochrome c family protein